MHVTIGHLLFPGNGIICLKGIKVLIGNWLILSWYHERQSLGLGAKKQRNQKGYYTPLFVVGGFYAFKSICIFPKCKRAEIGLKFPLADNKHN